MKILLVDLSIYPYAYFPQLEKKLLIERETIFSEFEPIYSPLENYFRYSFSDFELFDYECYHDLLFDLSKKLGYDNFKIVYKM